MQAEQKPRIEETRRTPASESSSPSRSSETGLVATSEEVVGAVVVERALLAHAEQARNWFRRLSAE